MPPADPFEGLRRAYLGGHPPPLALGGGGLCVLGVALARRSP